MPRNVGYYKKPMKGKGKIPMDRHHSKKMGKRSPVSGAMSAGSKGKNPIAKLMS